MSPPPPTPSRRARLLLLLVPVAVGLWWATESTTESAGPKPSSASADDARREDAAPGQGELRARPVPGTSPSAPVTSKPPEGTEADAESHQALWEKRLERARYSLDTYRVGTRYPPASRPMREHADQAHLAAPERSQPLKPDSSEVQLQLKQDKIFVVGDEVVHFSVSCSDGSTADQTPRPCQVQAATAHEAEHTLGGAAPLSPVPLTFVDDGSSGDAQAGDGTYTTSFQPAKQGFPLFSGTLRVSFQVRSGGVEGGAFFDILYTPSPPARFTGAVREAVEHGSLHLHLGVEVRQAGRYVIAGRMDDALGNTFAALSFNEELSEGAHEVDLFVFGKLILDERPAFPLGLRDVEGFLLNENADPDRQLMATLRGVVHTTGRYGSAAFSAEEWQSEERSRYLDRFADDVKEAEQALAQGKP